MLQIVIPVKNNSNYTQQVLKSVLEYTKNDFELFIVDDNSTDDTPELIDSYCEIFKNIKYKRFLEDIGVTRAWNEGIKMCNVDKNVIAILNNDIVVTPDWDVPLLKALDDGASIASPYHTRFELPSDFPTGIQRHSNKWVILGACFMCRKGLFKEIGLFPEQLKLWNNDRWIVSATHKIGGIMKEVPESYIHHYYSKTISTVKNLVEITNNDHVEYAKIIEDTGMKAF